MKKPPKNNLFKKPILAIRTNHSLLKRELLIECKKILQSRIDITRQIMDQAQASANDEAKSSVGDKYETGRAMMHLEKEKAEVQLAETLNLKRALDKIDKNASSETIQIGSVVLTDNGNFFLAVAIGEIEVNGDHFFAISTVSPLGKELLTKKVGDRVIVNNRSYTIKEVR